MSQKNIAKALDALRNDPKAIELKKEYKESDDMLTVYAQIATKLGFDVTAEDLKEFIDRRNEEVKGQTGVTMSSTITRNIGAILILRMPAPESIYAAGRTDPLIN